MYLSPTGTSLVEYRNDKALPAYHGSKEQCRFRKAHTVLFFFNPRLSKNDQDLTIPSGINVLSRGADKANPLYSLTCHSRIPASECHGLDYLLRLSILPVLTFSVDAFPSKSDLELSFAPVMQQVADGRDRSQKFSVQSYPRKSCDKWIPFDRPSMSRQGLRGSC